MSPTTAATSNTKFNSTSVVQFLRKGCNSEVSEADERVKATLLTRAEGIGIWEYDLNKWIADGMTMGMFWDGGDEGGGGG